MPELLLFFYVPIEIPCILEHVLTYFNEVCNLEEHEAVFLKGQNLIFSIGAGSIWFVFLS